LDIPTSSLLTPQFASPFAARTLDSLRRLGDLEADSRLNNLLVLPEGERLTLNHILRAAEHSIEQIARAQKIIVVGTRLRLRLIRKWVMITLYAADSRQDADVALTCMIMSDFARWACQEVLNDVSPAITERFGIPVDELGNPQDLHIIAMGKAGAGELNVSSDLDIVFLHRANPYPSGETSKAYASSEVLEKIAKAATQLLNDTDENGFVFRIDTRLRPFGSDGPLICSLPMLENYLVTNGREWERLAWLKATCIASTAFAQPEQRVDDLQQLNAMLTPFIFRRYLDFQSIDALRELHAQIRLQADQRLGLNAFDVKLGRGGIREIEFIAQLFQVIRGGRQPSLRNPSTVATLTQLAEHSILNQSQVDLLIEAYWFWRRTEHMLQYREDQQTHRLEANAHVIIAQMLWLSTEQFSTQVELYSKQVATIFDGVLGDRPNPENETEAVGKNTAFEERVEALKQTRRYRSATPATMVLVDDLIKKVTNTIGTSQTMITGELRLLALIESLTGRPGYLTLLLRFPEVCKRVIRLIGKASWAFDYLSTHPIVLDELLSDEWLESVDYEAWEFQVLEALNNPSVQRDTERRLDILREAHHAQVFRIIAQDIEGILSTEKLSDHLSQLADTILKLTLKVAWQHIQASTSNRMLKQETPEFAVIAYGKLGGKELGYASDLDLVYLFDKTNDIHDQADETYAVLAQRLSGFLSMRTSAGQLFDVDTRLRPNGASGLITVSIASFEKYQHSAAWTWEHQALTRARFVAGELSVGRKFEAIRRDVLSKKPDASALKTAILEMRKKMLEGHPNKTDLFDIKHDRGAMVDIEFIVQYLVLCHAHECETLLQNAGNIALLKYAAEADFIPLALATATGNAYRSYRQRQHAIRLNDATGGTAPCRVITTEFAVEKTAVLALWQWLLNSH
jgi:[glutamine synthetase] adenylyltransferase / [glutamine synthetase]-adenylyl-L-tyrosine phosphorylase